MSKIKEFFGMFELLEGIRKYSIMLIIVITGILFRIYNLIEGKEFVDLIKGCFIAFAASNASEHIIKAIQEKIKGVIKKWKTY